MRKRLRRRLFHSSEPLAIRKREGKNKNDLGYILFSFYDKKSGIVRVRYQKRQLASLSFLKFIDFFFLAVQHVKGHFLRALLQYK